MLPHNIIVLLPLIASALAVPVMKGDPCGQPRRILNTSSSSLADMITEAKSDINKRCTFDKRGAAERFNERYLLDVEGAEDGNNKRCDITLPGCNGRKKR